MIPGLVGALATGALGVFGGDRFNRAQGRQARLNREFQERMSSTFAQRAVADYKAAGLNPVLAYDKPASTPGGSVAQLEDSVGKGISSGAAAAQAMANIQLTKAQTEKVNAEAELAKADVSVRQVSGPGEPSWRDEQIAARVARLRDLAHQGRLQPHDERLRALQVDMNRELLKRGHALGETFKDLGALRDWVKGRVVSSGRDAAEAWKAWDSVVARQPGLALDSARRKVRKTLPKWATKPPSQRR